MKPDLPNFLPDDSSLLISAFELPGGQTLPGGLFAYTDNQLTQIEDQPTSGLYVSDQLLLRGLRHKDREATPSDIIIYEPNSLKRISLEGVANLHDILVFNDQIVAVSTANNVVVYADMNGQIKHRWQPNNQPDSWHINSLVVHNNQLLVSCFGQFTKTREWHQKGQEAKDQGSERLPATGCLIDIESGKTVLSGLQTPHSMRYDDDSWFLCESMDQSVVQRSSTGVEERRAQVGSWTRGLAVTDKYIFIGVSRWLPQRFTNQPIPPTTETARVVVLDRLTWQIVTTIPVPTLHIYDILVVPKEVTNWVPRAPHLIFEGQAYGAPAVTL